jgi:NADPH2:quinone reductase
MRAVVIEGTSLVVAERPDPEPGSGELLVRVAAAGVNGADPLQAAGHYPAPPGSPPDIPGIELAGTVEATGPGVLRYRVGDRVMAVVGGGGQAELATISERLALPVPPGLPWAQAGGFAEVFTTAHDALFTQGGLTMGERVLVTGAAGGVGIAGVQLASLAGARVTATVRNPGHRAAVAGLGDGVTVIAPDELAGSGPFDVVLELVGVPGLGPALDELADWGRIVVIGVGGGTRAELDLRKLMTKRARIMSSTLRSRTLEEKATAARRVEAAVLPWLAASRLEVPVEAAYPFDEVAAAYERFTAGGKLGKIVLVNPAVTSSG